MDGFHPSGQILDDDEIDKRGGLLGISIIGWGIFGILALLGTGVIIRPIRNKKKIQKLQKSGREDKKVSSTGITIEEVWSREDY